MDPLSASLVVASLAGAGASVYSAKSQSDQAKKAEQEQAKALKLQEEEALKKGPEATAINEEDTSIEEARKRLLRRGFLGTINTGMTGLGTQAQTAGTGLKGTLG